MAAKWTTVGNLWLDDPVSGSGFVSVGIFGQVGVIVRPDDAAPLRGGKRRHVLLALSEDLLLPPFGSRPGDERVSSTSTRPLRPPESVCPGSDFGDDDIPF